tara:strand:+ start:37 stop:600 length:564 start_codon:yes stop_codon:yes gene_type:complete
MQKHKKNIYLIGIIIVVALSRILPHADNFTPVIAISIFSGAYFYNKLQAILVPLLSIFISDIYLNNIVYTHIFDNFTIFYNSVLWQYIAYIVIVYIGVIFLSTKKSFNRIIFSTIFSCIIFFVISNYGFWLSSGLYEKNFSGLVTCYISAVPFFQLTLLGTLFYGAFLFGGTQYISRKYDFIAHANT